MDSTATDSFGAVLRRRRVAAGLSQEELAERASLSVRGVGNLEQGHRQAPRLATVRLLADALGLDDGGRANLIAAARPELATAPPISLSPVPAPVPQPRTPVIGRERERAELGALLSRPDVPLVTVTGPGGVGKTRLALHVAADLRAGFPDGIAFVSLAPVRNPVLVLPTVARAVGLHDNPDLSPLDQLATWLGGRSFLLVLDNLEQVVAAAPVLADLLARCPNLTVLATSRLALHIAGEHRYPLSPLRLPDLDRLPVLSELAATEAVALFVARAQATDPAFALREANALTVAAICARLDGLPLALELAAARVPTLPLPVLLARLEHALPLLTGGTRDAPDRQRTMRDAIAWSYDLLEAADQALLRHLAVFVGGFTLGAAEDLIREAGAENGRSAHPAPASVLDGIEALVAASLVQASSDPLAAEPRYRMLETVREFGLEQLAKRGEETAARDAHVEYFAALAERAAAAFYGPAEDAWFAWLEADHANFLSALAWCVAREDHYRLGRLVAALWWFWATGGHTAEGRTWLEQAVAATADAPPPLRAQVVCAAGYYSGDASLNASATPLLDECLALAEATGDREAAARAVTLLAIASPGSDLDRAEAFATEAAERWRALGPSVLWGECLLAQGHVAWAKGKLDRATTYIEEALVLARAHGFAWGIALAQNFLG
ncbi:MAG: ATP-binding protein, partial [Thermomicrobiales bacterium]